MAVDGALCIAPANPAKIESLLSALSSLRVVDGEKGFVADNVKDFAPFGLAGPGVTVELTTTRPSEEPLVLHVGKPVPDHPDRVYVRQGDQDDVVIVDAKALSEVPATAVALRSQQVADIEPAAVTQIEIKAKDDTFCAQEGPGGLGADSPRPGESRQRLGHRIPEPDWPGSRPASSSRRITSRIPSSILPS